MMKAYRQFGRGGLAIAGLLAAALLNACGFHLAGTRPLPEPLKLVHIDLVAPYRVSEPPIETSLRGWLTRRGARVLDDARPGATVIKLSELEETRRVLSVGSDGKALEFLLTTRVRYQVSNGTTMLIEPDTLQISRDYSFNAEQILAKEAEESRLREYIQNEMAEALLVRIETRLQHASPSLPEPAQVVPPTP